MLVNVGKLMSHTSTKGGGGVKHPFNPSLVDAWFMSGLSNADKPGSITGVMGNEMILKNFAFTSESGFGEGNYDGALVFDGSTITVGNGEDTDTLTLGIIRVGDESRRFLKGAIYYFALYNKSLTPEEIEEEKVKLENYWEGGKNELA